MGMVMVKCPQTGRAIPTGIKTDRDSFGHRAVFILFPKFVGACTDRLLCTSRRSRSPCFRSSIHAFSRSTVV